MIGDNIKKIRNAEGMTQKQLAEKVGLAEITIRQYESNKREPRIEVLNRLADALNINVHDLLSDSSGSIISKTMRKQHTNENHAFIDFLDSIGYGFFDYTYIDDSEYDNPYIIYSEDEDIKICLTDIEFENLISSVETFLDSELSQLAKGRETLRNDIF